jgi:predicted nucleic acid-binding protein
VAYFLDTNIFVRLLVRDHEQRYLDCARIFEQIEIDAVGAVTLEAIIAEVIFVLTSPARYRLSHAEAVANVRPLVELEGVRIEHKRSLLDALALFESTSLDFADCLAVAHTRRLGLRGIVSYDRQLARIPGVRWIEPPVPPEDGQDP